MFSRMFSKSHCLRERIDGHGRLHIALHDLPRWVDAGVDMVNLSISYVSSQDGDLAAIREMIPHAQLYLDLAARGESCKS